MSCLFNCWHPQPGLKTAVSNCTTNGASSPLCLSHSLTRESLKMKRSFLDRSARALVVCPRWVLRHATEPKITSRSSWKRPHHRRTDIRFIRFIRLLIFDENANMESPHIPDDIKWLWHTVAMVSKSFKPQSWIPPRLQISLDNCG